VQNNYKLFPEKVLTNGRRCGIIITERKREVQTMMISEHFKNDRADRYAFIATTMGVGKTIHTFKQPTNKWGTDGCVVEITTTGIAVVKTTDGMLVTMYVLTLKEAEKYFANTVMPMLLTAVIKNNMKKRFHLIQNEVRY